MSKAHDKAEAKPVHRHKPDHAQPVLTDAAASFGLPGSVLRLQNVIGNQAVQGLLARREAASKAKLVSPQSGAPDISREDDPETIARRHFEEGQAHFAAGRYEAALTRFERARQVPTLGAETNNILIWNLGVCNFHLERFATAVFYFEQYLSGGISAADRLAAENFLRQAREGTSADADRILEREDADIPAATGDAAADMNRGRALFDQATTLYIEGQYHQAIIIFEQLREMSDLPEEVRRDTIFNIARCNMRLRRAATAIIYLEQYLTMPGASRSEAAAMLTESQEAAGALTTGAQMRMVYNLAQDAYNAGNFGEAERLFRVILANPALDAAILADTHYNLAAALFRDGNYEEALTHFQAYAAQHPDDAEVQGRIAECQRRIGAAVPEAE